MLLRLNLTSKEIAEILNVTPDSVRVARYRLRKKLPISPKEDLVNFMLHQ
ncbi:helix-turn-helix transcriptional regulator [Tenacibaculum sp. SZ-18]|nr:sigma factor-like helix-turn-helix DNA-binding protein [Tenacibaculum sp. SZ-18]